MKKDSACQEISTVIIARGNLGAGAGGYGYFFFPADAEGV
jgi:hypothetical protein